MIAKSVSESTVKSGVLRSHTRTLALIGLCLCFALPARSQVTVAPFTTPDWQFSDNSGNPLNSGCVFFYAAGTTTPQNTYTDSTGTVAASNPVILNSAGRASIWLSGLAYKIKIVSAGGVNCATGTTISTDDNVTWTTPLSTFSGITVAGNENVTQPTAATSGANQSSFTDCLQSSYWTGAAAATDKWCWQDVLGTGSNPTTTETLSHSGSSGASTLDLSAAATTKMAAATITGALTAQTIDSIRYADQFAGADIGAQVNAAYANLSASGGVIAISPQNGCINYSTPISLSTLGKIATLELNGNCLNYTPTGGSSASITGISETNNTVTVTSTLNPGVGAFVAINGSCSITDGYQGVFKVATSSASNFTYTNAISGLAASTTCTTAQVTSSPGILIDFGAATGSSYPFAGVRNGLLQNTACLTIGGCGNATIGISVGQTNGGGGKLTFEKVRFVGWGVGWQINNQNGAWGAACQTCVFEYNTFGYQSTTPIETANFTLGTLANNARAADIQSSETKFLGTHLDSNTVAAVTGKVTNIGQTVTFVGVHFENFGSPNNFTTHYYIGDMNVAIAGGLALDDATSGTTDFWFDTNHGAASMSVYGLTVNSAGRTVTNSVFSVNGSGSAEIRAVAANNVIAAASICPTGGAGNIPNVLVCSVTNNLGSFPLVYIPRIDFTGGKLSMTETNVVPGTGTGLDVCYPDSTAHAVKCSYNNGAFSQVARFADNVGVLATGGTVTPALYASLTNCAAIGSAANPSVAACTAAPAGSVSCATNASTGTCTVNTTAVTANSEIFISQRTDTTTGTRLGVTCNTGKDSNSTSPQITAVSAGTSFTFQLGTFTTNPECFSYSIVN